jgi:hypothetical protein
MPNDGQNRAPARCKCTFLCIAMDVYLLSVLQSISPTHTCSPQSGMMSGWAIDLLHCNKIAPFFA